jgi:hypothetical protein
MKTLLLATALGAALLFAAGAMQAEAGADHDAAGLRPFPAPVGVDRA